jgi:uncharacterized protein YecE (DUF72 family)
MNTPDLHLGTIGWSYNFWKEAFYPKKTASKDFWLTTALDSTLWRLIAHSIVYLSRKP